MVINTFMQNSLIFMKTAVASSCAILYICCTCGTEVRDHRNYMTVTSLKAFIISHHLFCDDAVWVQIQQSPCLLP